jgi:hypothetical protein
VKENSKKTVRIFRALKALNQTEQEQMLKMAFIAKITNKKNGKILNDLYTHQDQNENSNGQSLNS